MVGMAAWAHLLGDVLMTATERALRDITATDTQEAWAEYLRLLALHRMRNRVAATPTADQLRRAGDTVTRNRMADERPDPSLPWAVVGSVIIGGLTVFAMGAL